MRFWYININYNTLIFVYFMKKYEEPKLRLHLLKTVQMIAKSFDVPEQQSGSSPNKGMEGFTVCDGWYEPTEE